MVFKPNRFRRRFGCPGNRWRSGRRDAWRSAGNAGSPEQENGRGRLEIRRAGVAGEFLIFVTVAM